MSISKRVVLRITKLGKYHRITVSEEVRKLLELREGDEIAWILEENRDGRRKSKERMRLNL